MLARYREACCRLPPLRRSYASIADKYQHKLQKRAGQEGLKGGNAIEQLRQKYKARVKAQEAIKPDPLSRPDLIHTPVQQERSTEVARRKAETSAAAKNRGHKRIDNYIAIDKLRLHSAKEIELLWRARFANNESALCAVIKGDTYKNLYRNARHHPMFVLPLFRAGQGVEMQFCQWTFPDGETAHLILTSLLEYKTRGEYARPHTIIEHHAELLDEKGVVLMKGDLTDSRALNGLQATWMLTLLQRFYCIDANSQDVNSQRRITMLQDFSAGKAFDVDALIEEAKSVPGAGEV